MKKKIVYFLLVFVCVIFSGCALDDVGNDLEKVGGDLKGAVEETVYSVTDYSNKDGGEISGEATVKELADGLYDSYYPVLIAVRYDKNLIFNKKETLKLFIDGNEITEIDQGELPVYGIILPVGEHTMRIASNILNSDSKDFTVGKDEIFDKKIPNLFIAGVEYKGGKAKFNVFIGTNVSDDLSYIDGYAQAMEECQPIGKYYKVIKKHKKMFPELYDD